MSPLAAPAPERAPAAESAAGHPASREETSPTLPDGRAYLASLSDDRRVFLDGARVRDVASHPAFRNAARSIARLYDALHDPARRDELTCLTDTGSNTRTHRAFRVARSREDLMAARDAIAAWSRLTYGWMGRTPDYKASLTNTFGTSTAFYGDYAANARRWYARAQETLPFICHAIANPPIDRDRPTADVQDVFVRAVRETDEGIVVSGAKVVATSAAIAQTCFIGQTPGTVSDDPAMSLSFMTPLSAPGVSLICRASYEQAASRHGSPFDYPLSSRFDENDAIITFDNVLVPWENVLIYRDSERVKRFFHATGFANGFLFHGCTRFAVKLDFIAGLLAKALRATGGGAHRGNRALLGEVIAWSHTFWSLSAAMASDPDPWEGGAVMPSRRAALAYCVLAPECYPRVKEIVQRTVASGLIYLPSSAADLANSEIEPLLSRYVRGSNGVDHRQRIKIMKLLWDAVGSEFAGRHELYERNYAGGWECIRLMVAGEADAAGRTRAMEHLVDQCLSEYDEHGWTDDTWITPSAETSDAHDA